MTDAAPARTALPAPVLTPQSIERLKLFGTAEFVVRVAKYDDLASRGIVDGSRRFHDFKIDFWRWFRRADELQLCAFWLLVEEQHALFRAEEAAPPAAPAAAPAPSTPAPRS